jgi:two-component system cell cycle response regulator
VALPSTHFAGSVAVAERLWREVADKAGAGARPEGAVPATVSVGVSLFPSRDVRTKDALLRAADAALRQAKRDGGNRICVFQQEGYLYTPVSVSDAPGAPATSAAPRGEG